MGKRWPAIDVSVPDLALRDAAMALLDDFQPTALDDPDPHSLRAFFASNADRDRAVATLRGRFPVTSLDIDDEEWAERSQAALRSVHAGDLVVAPPWDVPLDPHLARRTIVIRPSMGFGTGHHATTRLCLRALQTIPLEGASVVDVGTGSGVLAIAAVRLGAAHVLAIDTDVDAIECARENVHANAVADCVTLAAADIQNRRDARFDLLLANLTGALLRASSERLLRMVRTGGHLILSGFLLHEEDEVAGAFGPPARMALRDQEEEWGVIVFRVP